MTFIPLETTMKFTLIALGVLVMIAGAGSSVAAQGPDGKTIYVANCLKCHGATGVPLRETKEQFPKVATFADAKFVAVHSVDSIVKVLTHGKGEDMKSFKLKLSHEEMVAVANYVRGFGLKEHP
jgi:mono/diheme cytochrome c family protein